MNTRLLAVVIAILIVAGLLNGAIQDKDAPQERAEATAEQTHTEKGNNVRMAELAVIAQRLQACKALADKKAYGKKYEDYAFMVPGKDGYVFRSKQDFRQEFKLNDNDATLYRAFADALKSRGTTLVLAVIPTRGIVAADKLPADNEVAQEYDPVAARASYNAMLEKMNAHGVLSAGTPEPSSGAGYFNIADQHWTTKGAHDMARAVADMIKGTPVWDVIPHEDYKTEAGQAVSYDGRFGEAVKALCDMEPPQEKDMEMKTVPAKEGGDEASLFGDKPAPKVVLVGTSNSRRDEFDANFSGFLKQELSADVYNAAVSGGGMDDSLVAYLDSKEFRDNPPAVLVWELPGYYNLSGEGMENALRQGIASIYGYCDKPLVTYGPEVVGKDRLYLMKGLDKQKVVPGSAYIAIDFDKTVKKDFSVSFKTSDRKTMLFKFKKRREGNGDTFYYLPAGDTDVYLMDIALNSADGIEGLQVRAKLCPVPQPVE